MKKGFTLIELLAVIIVLAIILLVATPIVLDVVDNARSEANKETVYGIIQAGKNYYAESMLDTEKKEKLNGESNIYGEIELRGEKPGNGNLFVNEEGQVAALVTIGKKCYKKNFSGELEEISSDDSECEVGTVINDKVSPVIKYSIEGTEGNNNWYISEVYVTINATDEGSGIKEYSWCSTVDESCEPANKETTSRKLEVLNGYKVCAQAIDKASNESELVCTEVFNIDTVSPEFEGIEDKTIAKDEEIDLKEGVSVSDSLSGMEGTFTVTPEEVDTTKTGTTEVKYVAYDKAGNIKEVTRKIIVSADAPSVTFTADTGAINSNGWAKEDFYVEVNVKDNSGHGIKEFKVCTITGNNECNPENGSVITDSTSTVRLISTESNNNRICVQATDKADKISETICSDAYKLDKTAPGAGTIEIEGTKGENEWYTSDVTINVIDGTDELSGHLETTSNITSITENTTGTTVTVTTKDKAGNISTNDYTIKVDKTIPVVTIEEPTIDGSNGWYKTKPTIKVTASDTISTYDRLKICEGTNCEPTEEITESIKNITISDTKGTQVCVIAYDKAGNVSTKTCSNVIKVDTVLPSISGIADITVQKGASVNLSKDVEVIDTTSEVDKYTITPETVDTTKAGITNVTYKVIDKAGNEKTITRKVIVSAEAPNVTFTAASGAINNNGWAKNNFYVTINAQDNSGHGIKEMRICTATTNTCNPANGSLVTGSSATREIATESSNNRICVQATDNYNQTSETICSDAYKLDKTVPTAGTIKVNGSSTINAWYNGNVTIEAVNGTDSLSQHASTTVNTTSITSNTTGTTVTVTTTDKAGNSSSRNYTIKVDKTEPIVTITKASGSTKLTATINPTTTGSNYSYQWYKGSSAISGATSTVYTPVDAGTYSVKVTTGAGKTGTSNEITIQSYTVSYNMNGGTGSISNQTKVQDISLTLSNTIPTRSGYTFQGWGSSTSDTSVDYAKGATYTANSGTTLYAIWKKTITVTFNANGASISKTSATCDMYNSETSCNVTAPTISRTGYTIVGFNTSSAATTAQVSSGGTATVSANTTYYAITKINSYTVSITTPTNGTLTTSSSSINYGGSVTLTVTPSSGYYLSSLSCTNSYVLGSYTTGSSATGKQTINLSNNNKLSNTTCSATFTIGVVRGVQAVCSNYSSFAGNSCPSGQTIYVLEDVKYCLDYAKNNGSSATGCTCYGPYDCSQCVGEGCGSCASANAQAVSICKLECAFTQCRTNYKIYGVTLNGQSATTTGTTYVDAVYNKPLISITNPTRTGYTFGGYYTSTGGSGTQYYNGDGNSTRAYDKTTDLTLYAKWTANKYTVTLNNQSATTSGTTSVTATYDSSLPSITIPTKTGYDFLGYYTGTNGTGTRIYTEAGVGIAPWKIASNTTLYAYWIANTVSVTCSNYGSSTATYVATTCINDTALVEGKVKYCLDYAKNNGSSATGCTCTAPYDCSYCVGEDCGSCASANSQAISECKIKCAYSNCKNTLKIYTVTLNGQSATASGTLTTDVAYGSPMPDIVVPTRTGYTFGGYYTGTNGSGTQYYNANGKSVRNYDKTAALTLYAKWTANKYTVTLNNQSATTAGTTSVTATYDSAMPSITIPTKSGYTFFGYYTGTNGTGTQHYSKTGTSTTSYKTSGATTLYAFWIANTVSVSCSNYSWANLTCSGGNATVTANQKYCLDYAKNNGSSATGCTCTAPYDCSSCVGAGCGSCASANSQAISNCKNLCVYNSCIN